MNLIYYIFDGLVLNLTWWVVSGLNFVMSPTCQGVDLLTFVICSPVDMNDEISSQGITQVIFISDSCF